MRSPLWKMVRLPVGLVDDGALVADDPPFAVVPDDRRVLVDADDASGRRCMRLSARSTNSGRRCSMRSKWASARIGAARPRPVGALGPSIAGSWVWTLRTPRPPLEPATMAPLRFAASRARQQRRLVEGLGEVGGAAAGEPDEAGLGDLLRVLGDVGLVLVADAHRHRLDAEVAEVGHAHLLPPRHHVVAFGGAGGGDDQHRAAAVEAEEVLVDDVHRRRVLTGAGEDEGAEVCERWVIAL